MPHSNTYQEKANKETRKRRECEVAKFTKIDNEELHIINKSEKILRIE
jgi:hypothetical protein